jgi:hypothetical protein
MTGFKSKRELANIRWLGPYAPSDRHADDVTVSEMVRLRKENEWYRDILRRISQSQYNADSKDLANAALEQKGD